MTVVTRLSVTNADYLFIEAVPTQHTVISFINLFCSQFPSSREVLGLDISEPFPQLSELPEQPVPIILEQPAVP